MVISGFSLIKEKPFGYISSGIALMKGITTCLGLVVTGILEIKEEVFTDFILYIMFIIVAVLFSIAMYLFISNIETTKK